MTDEITMGELLEEKIRDLVLGAPEWDPVKVVYRGEPAQVPVRLHPFGVVFLTVESEATGEDGYSTDTGPIQYLRYDGYVSIEVLIPDVTGLVPDAERKADIPSYKACRRMIQAARRAIVGWTGPLGSLTEDPVTRPDGLETTSSIRIDGIRNAVQSRPRTDNYTNMGTFEFHLFTRLDASSS